MASIFPCSIARRGSGMEHNIRSTSPTSEIKDVLAIKDLLRNAKGAGTIATTATRPARVLIDLSRLAVLLQRVSRLLRTS
jgi:hypothetical protein